MCLQQEEKSNKHSCGSKKVDGGLWKIGNDWPTGDRMEKGQPEGPQKKEETGTDSGKERENKFELNF